MPDSTNYDMIIEGADSTVVAEYVSPYARETSYQSEAELERALINQLTSQSYERLGITSNDELVANLRTQLEKLNNYQFTDHEWRRFFVENIAVSAGKDSIALKTQTIQEDHVKNLYGDDDKFKRNIYLLDKDHIHNNHLQVINQYEVDGSHKNRYDVTLLVNGLPLVHIELKRRGVPLKEAFNQINRYQRDSFWADSGLFEFVQLFVISNGTHTKYYSNTTRWQHVKEKGTGKASKGSKTSNSYEFTSWWADANNKRISDLMDFTGTFLAKHTLLNIITKYCVFTSDRLLLAMRPYQIVATERILSRIEISTNYKKLGTVQAGGFVWHTTGSGKTLTSFKTAQLASRLDYIDKVIFVVDRKDLDYQTMKEYDKFAEGSANSNTSTRVLAEQLSTPNGVALKGGKVNQPIIITTIQKLDKFIKRNAGHTILDGHVVLIFDECHRSQFGDMHTSITGAFRNYHLFGFTGTPIFAENAGAGSKPGLRTTSQAFGCNLHGDPSNCPEGVRHQQAIHTYSIVDAISDKNVLPFKVDYMRTIREADEMDDAKVRDINREKALAAPERVAKVVGYILEHFVDKTKRSENYAFLKLMNTHEVVSSRERGKVEEMKEKVRLSGFNSIFAVSSIDMAKAYYHEFARQQAELPEAQRLKVATIFSYGANEDENEFEGIVDENSDNADGLDASSRDFLERAIGDYNGYFATNYDTSSDKFQNYYKDVSLRMKNREIDLLIVVNMFLTGFDATTLNTLWVDKNLRMHGLLQAYSRTNRILNSVKSYGQIVTFRNLEEATNKALELFGDKEASGIVLLKSFDEYMNGYSHDDKHVSGYNELIDRLVDDYPVGQQIDSEAAKKQFIKLYGEILRVRNILTSFDEFSTSDRLSERDLQDYHSQYIDLYEEFRRKDDGGDAPADINDDVVFEIELIKQIDVNIDYILELIRQYRGEGSNNKTVELHDIDRVIDSSVELRNKKDLIEQFISSLTPDATVDDSWEEFVKSKRIAELDRIIADENLDREGAYRFVQNAFRDGAVQTSGTAIDKILPPVDIFRPDNLRYKTRGKVLARFTEFFERFFGISSREL